MLILSYPFYFLDSTLYTFGSLHFVLLSGLDSQKIHFMDCSKVAIQRESFLGNFSVHLVTVPLLCILFIHFKIPNRHTTQVQVFFILEVSLQLDMDVDRFVCISMYLARLEIPFVPVVKSYSTDGDHFVEWDVCWVYVLFWCTVVRS